jgi:acetylornithine deacetylase/succinyl-diaminopimelate desuccinylase-like protein
VPDLTPAIIAELLRKHLDAREFHDIEIIEIASAPYAKAPSTSTVARAAVEVAPDVYAEPPVVYPLDPASGPVGAVCGVNTPPTPVVSFGIAHAGSNPHGPNENIRLADFVQGIKYFGRVIHRLAQISKEDVQERRTVETIVPISR